MKRIKCLLFLILLTIIFTNKAVANQYFTYDTDYNTNHLITNDIIAHDNGYILVNINGLTTTLTSNNNKNETLISKQFSDLTNTKIINYNDDYIVVGLSNNALNLYKINTNLQILSSKLTTIVEPNVEIKLYNHDNKIYMMLLEVNQLLNNNLYELDENLNIIEKKISSYDSELLKNILDSDYYLIHNNGELIEDRINYYQTSTYTEQYNILVGYQEDSLLNTNAIISLYDKEGNSIWKLVNEFYNKFIDLIIINNKIVIIGEKKDLTNSILIYDYDKTLISEADISKESLKPSLITKVNNKVVLVYNSLLDTKSLLSFYNYNSYIYSEESNFGSLKVAKTAVPSNIVSLNVSPNSGYEIRDIVIKDEQGNIVPVNNLQFKMPASDVEISVDYDPIVINPETADIAIIALIIFSFVLLFILIRSYIKYSWLK